MLQGLSKAKVASWMFLTIFVVAALESCGMHPPDAAPAQMNVVSLDPHSWYIMHSSGTGDHPKPLDGAAWALSLPDTDVGHLNYVETPYRITVRPQQIVMTYRVVESPEAIPVSDEEAASPCRDHDPCTPVAEFHVFFEQRDDDLYSECGRWWYRPGFRLTDVADDSYNAQPFVADGQSHTLTIPLVAESWTSVNGLGSDADFENSLTNVGYVGITFGGSDFFGHGVNVKQGTVQFQMIDYHVE